MRKSIVRHRRISRITGCVGCLILVVVLTVITPPSVSHAVSAGPGPTPQHRVLFDIGVHSTITPAQAAAAAASSSFTQFTATVQAGTSSYTYVMAGKNPTVKHKNAAATIQTKLVPLIVKGTNGDVWDPTTADSCDSGASALSRVQQSPIVVSQPWTWGGTSIGTGQLTDAFQRAEFWKYAQPSGINPSYGVNLAWTTLKPVTITVPQGDDQQMTVSCGNGIEEEVSESWLDSYLQKTVIPALASKGVKPSTVPFFLLHNVVMYDDTGQCCVLGYHNAFTTSDGAVQTYGVTDYNNSGNQTTSTDIDSFSHELAEWQDDPYGNNPTPGWGPIGQATGCQSNLEAGDPLSGTSFAVTVGNFTYHPQELAFFSWFYHQSPSLGVNGWYSDQGNFGTFAPGCWTAVQAPLPAGGTAANPQEFLRSVVCPSVSNCVAVGHYIDASNNQQGLMVTGSGASWGATEAPLPANAAAAPPGVELNSVACASATSCTAVGDYTDSSGNQQGLVLTGSGTSWAASEAPLPADASGSPGADLSSVSCPSASSCIATGSYLNSSGYQAFMLTGSGTSWTAKEVPMPGDAAANPFIRGFIPIACSSVSSCTAVTTYTDSAGDARGALITGSGTSWTAIEVPLPANAATEPGTGMNAVACPSASACVAAGTYEDTSGNQDTLLATGSGRSWTAIQAPLPANATANQEQELYSVACLSSTSCTAVGTYTAGLPQGLIVSGSGTSWQASEAPGNNGYASLYSVACPSTSQCVAAGSYGNSPPNNDQPILAAGSRISWIGVTVPLPPGASPGISLQSTACAAAFSCVAVGYYGYPSPIEGILLAQTS